ncbi:MAG: aminotransferase class V-fold PLP-dependent enzyme [Rhodoferax sp.]|nr:aminotransferase class V-fold PLP-dependent enzyme [Rhodoferax sp.]
MPQTIYLDSNATTPVLPAAIDAATRVMAEQFGNPSSSHSHGLVAKDVLNQVRQSAAQVVGAGEGHVVFTSGATEGIQTAVLSALCAIRARRVANPDAADVLVYGATEHKAVPHALAHWNAVLGLGLELRALPLDANGQYDLQTLAFWLPRTALLCTMAANNETGVVGDMAGIDRLLGAAPRRPLWLVDCVQALGKLDLDLQRTGIDYATFSGHKLYAPKGVGLLYVRRSAPFTPLMAGGGQEGGLRSGTENMPGIAAFGAVLQALQRGQTFASHATLRGFRDQLEQSLRKAFPTIVFNAPLAQCLPTTLNFSVPGLASKTLVDVFDAAGLRVSAGSACSAAKATPSDVLVAMGLPAWQCESAVRLSIGALATAQTIDVACTAIARCGEALRAEQAAREQEADGSAANAPSAPAPALAADGCAVDAAAFTLQWAELDDYLRTHPGACLVDLREGVEHQVSGGICHGDWKIIHTPVSALTAETPPWCAPGAAPVVLVCRSGNRSLRVAQWLHSQGHTAVRHLHGGLALRP